MLKLITKLTTSGNSRAVRLPKDLLRMSGLGEDVILEARRGQITIRKPTNPRASWEKQINKVLKEESHLKDDDFADMQAMYDPWDELAPWDGPTYEEWLEQNAKK